MIFFFFNDYLNKQFYTTINTNTTNKVTPEYT